MKKSLIGLTTALPVFLSVGFLSCFKQNTASNQDNQSQAKRYFVPPKGYDNWFLESLMKATANDGFAQVWNYIGHINEVRRIVPEVKPFEFPSLVQLAKVFATSGTKSEQNPALYQQLDQFTKKKFGELYASAQQSTLDIKDFPQIQIHANQITQRLDSYKLRDVTEAIVLNASAPEAHLQAVKDMMRQELQSLDMFDLFIPVDDGWNQGLKTYDYTVNKWSHSVLTASRKRDIPLVLQSWDAENIVLLQIAKNRKKRLEENVRNNIIKADFLRKKEETNISLIYLFIQERIKLATSYRAYAAAP